MARRPGLTELAAAAGVSVATVDRVLNGRETVKPETAALVAQAALRIGHPAARRLSPAEPEARAVRFGVVLHKSGQEFYQAFARQLTEAVAAAPGVQGSLEIAYASSQSPSEVAGLLRSVARRCDVLAATAVNHPEVTAAVEGLKEQGIPVFALLSDFAQGVRAGYVGLNNLKTGRLAGWITALAAKGPGKVAVFVGGHRWQGHELRETGYRAYLRESAPHLEVMDTLVNLETRQLTYEATLALLARQPQLRGIYVAGGGMEGAIAALREARQPGEVALVVNELTSESRSGLIEGLVTLVDATPLPELCRDLVGLMVQAAGQGGGAISIQHFLRPDLHVSESL